MNQPVNQVPSRLADLVLNGTTPPAESAMAVLLDSSAAGKGSQRRIREDKRRINREKLQFARLHRRLALLVL